MASSRNLTLLLIFCNIIFLFNGSFGINQRSERAKRSLESNSVSTEFPKPSEKCQQLNITFHSENGNFGKETHLDSEKSILQLTWTGENHEKVLIVTSDATSNKVFLSNHDFSFKDITDSIFSDTPSNNMEINLVQHPTSSMTNYLSAIDLVQTTTGSELFISTDASVTYKKVSLDFTITPNKLFFHFDNNNLLLAIDNSAMKLYLSKDKGFTWECIASDVTQAKWSENPSFPNDIFIIKNTKIKSFFFGIYKFVDTKNNVLHRINNFNKSDTTLLKSNVYSIGTENVFLYASIIIQSSMGTEERIMQVSTDGGRMWNRVQLPTITSDRFYSILDLSEGLIFLHVDNPGDTGRGVLYTSDATGIIFSKSLDNHLYPNYENVMDFYRVASCNGTFITSILATDDSVKTVISFDRGSEWHPITRPLGVPCHDETKVCTLHIHNQFSLSKGILAPRPLSVASAPGLILAHGHVAESLQTSDPDLYVSNDGGHNWIFGLKGPHHYQIADQGNLLLALPATKPNPDTLYFSTDRGRCWVSHKFTDESLVFKQMLVTPDNLESTVVIWGYTVKDKKWHSFIFDFNLVVTQKCTASDYEEWSPASHRDNKCVLGSSRTFQRPKADSWCLNAASFSSLLKAEQCPCTEDDYKCDYGYKRSGEGCVKDVNVVDNIHICLRNHHQKLVPVGYHKIPGDECHGGVSPPASHWVDMESECKGVIHNYYDQALKGVKEGEIEKDKEEGRRAKNRSVFYIIFFFFLIILTTIALVYAARKYKLFNRQPTYKYSSIRAVDDEEGNRLMDGDDDDNDGGNNGYNKISGPTLVYGEENPLSSSSQQQQQTGYVHPKLMALTNPHLINNAQQQQQQRKVLNDTKSIPESDVELLQ